MRVGVATIVSGRREHLRRQATAVAGTAGVARYVVATMDREPVTVPGARVIQVQGDGTGLALAAARNQALEALADCELAVLLDVDCIPDPRLIKRYAEAARELRDTPSLLCGPVGYLDPLAGDCAGPDAAQRRQARARVIRAFPAQGIAMQPRAELFWSLSFAVAPEVHRAIGGFDEGFVGYGAEDTDYGLRAARAGVGLWLVAGAWAYHQHHPPTAADDVARVTANARRFHERWGFWPMSDRLARWAADGVIEWTPGGSRCELLGGQPGGGQPGGGQPGGGQPGGGQPGGGQPGGGQPGGGQPGGGQPGGGQPGGGQPGGGQPGGGDPSGGEPGDAQRVAVAGAGAAGAPISGEG